MKKNKNLKKQNARRKKRHGNPYLLILPIVLMVILLSYALCLLIKNPKEKKLKIAFYNLENPIEQYLRKTILEEANGYAEFTLFTLEELAGINPEKISKNFDLVFTWNDYNAKKLQEYANNIPESCMALLPRAISKKGQKSLPVLLDHYELSYNIPLKNKLNLEYPENFEQFVTYLEDLKEVCYAPFIIEGANDRSLFALFSALAESLGGIDAYNNLCKELINAERLDDFIDVDLGINALTGQKLKFRTLLDILIEMKNKELIYPKWYKSQASDILEFMEQNQVGVIFQSLKSHREIPFKLIKSYYSDRFVIASSKNKHGLIAPSVNVMCFGKNQKTENLIKGILDEYSQENFSTQTRLAPVSSKGAAFDRQSDDVRFFAASCSEGPVPDVYILAKENQKVASIANHIRVYLEQNNSVQGTSFLH